MKLTYIFDLKGSSVDRLVKGRTKPRTTLKDQNFIIAKRNHPELTSLHPRKQRRLINVMRKDVEYLRSRGLMDYSLLLAIEKTNSSAEDLHRKAESLPVQKP